MSRTDLPPLGDPNPHISIAEAVKNVRDLHFRAQGDLDKAENLQEGHYYAGMVDACTELENILTIEKEGTTPKKAEKNDD